MIELRLNGERQFYRLILICLSGLIILPACGVLQLLLLSACC